MNNAMVPKGTRVSLVRHGHIQNPDNVYHGRLPGFPLSERGEAQAEAAGALLRDEQVTAIYSSPMLRARQTAGRIRLMIGLADEIRLSHSLHEIYSPFDGRPAVEMDAIEWDFYAGISAPYEQPTDVLARVRQFFAHARQAHRGQHTIGVTHADPLAFAILWACGLPITAANRRQLVPCGVPDGYPATASITTFVFQSDDPAEIPHFTYRRPY